MATAGFSSLAQAPETQETTPAVLTAGMAGFASAKAGPVVDDNADDAEVSQAQGPQEDEQSKLAEDFSATEFMRLITMLYGIKEIPTELADTLSSFKLDSSKPKPETYTDTLYAIADGINIEITKDSVLADDSAGPLSPALAYKMAAAAALNPAMKTLTLTGSEEDRATLMWAAKHFDLDVTDESIPALQADKLEPLVQNFAAFEREMGFENSMVADLIGGDEVGAAPQKKAEPAPKQERREPRFSQQPAMA